MTELTVEEEECFYCQGTGVEEDNPPEWGEIVCNRCNGTGVLEDE